MACQLHRGCTGAVHCRRLADRGHAGHAAAAAAGLRWGMRWIVRRGAGARCGQKAAACQSVV